MTSYGTMLSKIAGPKSLRLGATDFFGMGRNFQNITKDQRKYVIPPAGMGIVNIDQKGADQKIIAYESPPGKLRALFENGIKPATYISAFTFGKELSEYYKGNPQDFEDFKQVPIDKLKTTSFWPEINRLTLDSDNWSNEIRYYFFGKKLGHSLNNGASHSVYIREVLKETEGRILISEELAKRATRTYQEDLFPEIFNGFHVKVERDVKQRGIIYTLFGTPYKITGPIFNLKDFIIWIPQATVAEITHRAVVKMEKYIEEAELNWLLFNNTHDSMAHFAPIEELEACGKKGQEFMETELTSSRGEKFKMGAGISIGFNWGPYHEKKNPKGLKEVA